jgi:hypothetical protein
MLVDGNSLLRIGLLKDQMINLVGLKLIPEQETIFNLFGQ